MRKGLAKRGCRAMRWLKPRHAQCIARGSSVGCTRQLPHGCWDCSWHARRRDELRTTTRDMRLAATYSRAWSTLPTRPEPRWPGVGAARRLNEAPQSAPQRARCLGNAVACTSVCRTLRHGHAFRGVGGTAYCYALLSGAWRASCATGCAYALVKPNINSNANDKRTMQVCARLSAPPLVLAVPTVSEQAWKITKR